MNFYIFEFRNKALKIYFHDVGIISDLLGKGRLRKFLLYIFNNEKKALERVDIIFCTDEYILRLNKEYLKHDYYTDTLSFLLSNQFDPIIGEIYISLDRVSSNAKDLKIPYQTEQVRVIIHSCLHLCGYLDKPKTAALKMEARQEKYLKDWMFHVEHNKSFPL